MGRNTHHFADTYMLDRTKKKVLTAEEEVNLARLIQAGGPAGDAAKAELVTRNVRLAILFAKRIHSNHMSLEDSIQEGMFGLIRAAEKFDPDRGVRFATYANWWIRQAILRAALSSSEIPIPSYLLTAQRNILELEATRGGPLSDEECAEYLGVYIDVVRRARCIPQAFNDLDAPSHVGDGDVLMIDRMVDERVSPETMERDILVRQVRKYLETEVARLSERDRSILEEWTTNEDATFNQLGRKHKVSHETIRQVLLKATRLTRTVMNMSAY